MSLTSEHVAGFVPFSELREQLTKKNKKKNRGKTKSRRRLRRAP